MKPLPASQEAVHKVKRLAKEVYKANTLVEAQAEQTRQAVAHAGQALTTLEEDRRQVAQRARLDLVKALLPVLDGVEAGLASGVAQLKAMYPTMPDAARLLAKWLDGQRLLRERLLKLLEAEGVQPIPAVGRLFDPYRHVAVKTVVDPEKPKGLIVAEQRRGYLHGNTVLRYADVVVNRRSEEGTRE